MARLLDETAKQPMTDQVEQLPILHVQGTVNVRVAGASPAGVPWLVRSASLDNITEQGLAQMIEMGVSTVIDLRETSEGHQVSLPGLRVHRIPLYRLRKGPPALGTIRQILEFLVFERGRHIGQAVEAIAFTEGAALVHCAIGKDRTGVVTALTRLAAGDGLPEVLDDYELSGSQLPDSHRHSVRTDLEARFLDPHSFAESFALHTTSPREVLAEVLARLTDAYGDLAQYLSSQGLSTEALSALRSKGSPA